MTRPVDFLRGEEAARAIECGEECGPDGARGLTPSEVCGSQRSSRVRQWRSRLNIVSASAFDVSLTELFNAGFSGYGNRDRAPRVSSVGLGFVRL
jgi:hypothetical protein